MNGEAPSVPIITLAGVSSLTNLLPELPLPTPLPQTVNNKSLLYQPRLAAEAHRLLGQRNDALAKQLVTALRLTNADHVEMQDSLPGDLINSEVPELLKSILNLDPDVFKSATQNLHMPGYPHSTLHNAGMYPDIVDRAGSLSDRDGAEYNDHIHGGIYPTPLSNGPSAMSSYHDPNLNLFLQSSSASANAPDYSSFLMNGGSGGVSGRIGGLNSSLGSTTMPILQQQHPSAALMNLPNSLGGPHHGPGSMAGYLSSAGNVSMGIDEMMGPMILDPSTGRMVPSAQVYRDNSPLTVISTDAMFDSTRAESPAGRAFNNFGGMAGTSDGSIRQSSNHGIGGEPRVLIEPLNMDGIGQSSRKGHGSSGHHGHGHGHGNHSGGRSDTQNAGMKPAVISLTRIDDGDGNKKYKVGGMHYNVVQSESSLKIKLSKAQSNNDVGGHRGTKRRREDYESDDSFGGGETSHHMTMAQMQEMYGEFATSLTERMKRRRRGQPVSYCEEDENGGARSGHRSSSVQVIDDSSQSNSSAIEAQQNRNKHREYKELQRRQQQQQRRVTGDADELMETPTFRRFNLALEGVLDAAEDFNLSDIRADDDEDDEDGRENGESFLTKSQLAELYSEAAKLKSISVMNQVPYEKLIKVLTILQYSIRQGCRVTPPPLDPDERESEEEQMFRERVLDKVMSAVDAALAVMLVMTSPDMPKEVFLEDVIEKVVTLTKTQLTNAIYPMFDPIHRVDPHNKSGLQTNSKMKRAKSSGAKDRTTLSLYNKLSELTSLLAELIDIQELTDTIILQTSTLAVAPFFVENIQELQLNALKLVTNIFSRYEKHRHLILEDILSSLARLPTSKKNIRSYRLNANDEYIQMVTALALQLIQCVVKLNIPEDDDAPDVDDGDGSASRKKASGSAQRGMDREVMILTSYETAMRTAHNFLAVFLAKCTSKTDDDYRKLFADFVQDLLSTVNKPEWPAAELLLSLLGNLLVKQFSNKSVEMSLRVASLDYLGIVASRLRKDAVSSHLNEDIISDIIARITETDLVASDASSKNKRGGKGGTDGIDRTQSLQRGLLEYLVYSSQHDPALIFARQFYIAQWYRDCSMEVEKAAKRAEADAATKNKKEDVEVDTDDEDDDYDDDDETTPQEKRALKLSKKAATELDTMRSIQDRVDQRKLYLTSQIAMKLGAFSTFKPSPSKLDYESALLATRYLASNRPFSQSFDIYLTQILKVLRETAVAVRTKALKCLALVVEADPTILARTDMQMGVHNRFLDQSTAVREAAIELVGKFILVRPELTSQYYDMLSERILDTGVSVRKRVIKIFRDICIEQPDFQKISEMCVKMIRRVNDEEGIRKLVNETFQAMWFTPVRDKDTARLVQKVTNISDVVAACRDSGSDWLEQLMDNLLKKEEDSREKPMEKSCVQIVDCLVENVLQLDAHDSGSKASNPRLIACFATLYLFCKVKPDLLMSHCTTIHPYLEIKCTDQGDVMLLHNVTRILELGVPLMDHPSETFLAQLEEDMMKLIFKHGMMIVQSCVSCLGAIVNGVTHNYQLVRDCFQKFFDMLSRLITMHQTNSRCPQFVASRPSLMRALFTVGVMCKHFDFDSEDFGEKRASIRERVFEVIIYFLEAVNDDDEVRLKALSGLGFFVTRHYEFMLGKQLRDIYQDLLTNPAASTKMCCQVLRNLQTYLIEEEVKMMKADSEWRKVHDKEDLKELGDVQSGMASTIIQVYLKQVLESFFHIQAEVRLSALEVIILILRQGLVHPVQNSLLHHVYRSCFVHQTDEEYDCHAKFATIAQTIRKCDIFQPAGLVQHHILTAPYMCDERRPFLCMCVPYLITMGSDSDVSIRVKADQQLQEIDKKYPGFIQMKAMHGIKMSYRLQKLLQNSRRGAAGQGRSNINEPLRGVRIEEDNLVSLNSYIYSLIRSNRGQRRALLTTALNMFDDTARVSLEELIYMADNIAYFPYQQQEEPLFIMHQLDIIVSVSGSNLLQSFKEVFYPGMVDTNQAATAAARLAAATAAAEAAMEEGIDDFESSESAVALAAANAAVMAANAAKSRADEDDDEDEESLAAIFPEDATTLQELYIKSQGCVLLLVLKQHLKDMYGFTDAKIQNFSPTDSAKTFEKPLNRKPGVRFHPRQALELVQSGRTTPLPDLDEAQRRDLIRAYLNFKELMLTIDPDEKDEDDDDAANSSGINASGVGTNTSMLTPAERQQQQQQRQQHQRQQQQRLQQLLQHRPPVAPTSHVESSGYHTSGPVVMLDPITMNMGEYSNTMMYANQSLSRPSTSGSVAGGLSSQQKLKRPVGTTPRVNKTPKSKGKKKRKRFNASDSEESSDDASSDPDWG